MSEEEKDLVDFLYRLIEQGTHKIYDDDLNDRKICEYINLIENQQEEIEKQQKEIEKLKDKMKKAKQYIKDGMYIDDNPTICGDEEDTIIELPISLYLYNEDLRELLELLEEE